MKLNTINLSRLQVLEAGQFIMRYFSDFESLNLDLAEDPNFMDLHNTLLQQSPPYNLALAQIQAKAESEILCELDANRDKKITILKRCWSIFEREPPWFENGCGR